MKKYDIAATELKINLAKQGIKVRPSYCHDDYMVTSFSMPYTTKNKLNRLCKHFGVTRSSLVAYLIDNYYKAQTGIDDMEIEEK